MNSPYKADLELAQGLFRKLLDVFIRAGLMFDRQGAVCRHARIACPGAGTGCRYAHVRDPAGRLGRPGEHRILGMCVGAVLPAPGYQISMWWMATNPDVPTAAPGSTTPG